MSPTPDRVRRAPLRSLTAVVLLPVLTASLAGCMAIQRFLVPPAEPRAGAAGIKVANVERAETLLIVGSIEGLPDANAIALRGDRVLAVGLPAAITAWATEATAVVRMPAVHVTSGLGDASVRLEDLAMAEDAADLRAVRDATGLLRATETARAVMGDWLWGHGLSAAAFDAISPDALAAALPDVAAWLGRADGQAAWLTPALVSQLPAGLQALAAAQRGRLEGPAVQRAWRALPPMRALRLRPLVRRVLSSLQQQGVTEAHSLGDSAALVEAIGYLDLAGQLPVRARVYLDVERPEAAELLAGRALPLVGTMAQVAGVMVWLDGSLATRTAALSQPYADQPAVSGALRYTDEALTEVLAGADAQGVQVAVHAAGDAALVQVLRVLAAAQRPRGAQPVRLEGLQVVPDAVLSQLGQAPVECGIAARVSAAEAAVQAARLGPNRAGWLGRGLALSRWCKVRAGAAASHWPLSVAPAVANAAAGKAPDPLAGWRTLASTPAMDLAADATAGDVAAKAWQAVSPTGTRAGQSPLRAGDRADLTLWSHAPQVSGPAPHVIGTVAGGSLQRTAAMPH